MVINRKRMFIVLTIFAALLFFLMISGCRNSGPSIVDLQKEKANAIPPKYESSALVVLESKTELEFKVGKSGNLVLRRDTIWAYVNKRNPEWMETIRLYDYDSHEKPLKVTATAYYPDGSKWSLNSNGVKRKKINFSNATRTKFSIPRYQAGTLIKLDIKREYIHPEFIGTFRLRQRHPTLNRSLSLTMPEDCQLKHGLENPENATVTTSSKEENGMVTIQISAQDLDGRMSRRKTEFPERWYAAFYVSFPPKGKRSYSWQQLGDHYLDHLDITFDASPEIKALGNTIAGTSQTELIRNSFDAIVGKIRYHADSDGDFAFYPRDASVIFNHGYGDCKEISTVLRTLLRTRSVDTHLALISTWGNFQPVEKYPSLDNFNHLILSATSKKGDPYFIDGTQTWAASNNSYYPLIGRTAYVMAPGSSKLVPVEPDEKFENRIVTHAQVTHGVKKRWVLKGEIALYGFPALRLFNQLHWSDSIDDIGLLRDYLQEEFDIYPQEVAFDALQSDEITIRYKASLQENFIALGKGGIRLSLPGLSSTSVDKSLIDKKGPKFFEPFEQHDTWELSFVPDKNDLRSVDSPIANCDWSALGSTIKRTYIQRRIYQLEERPISEWIDQLENTTNSISWR